MANPAEFTRQILPAWRLPAVSIILVLLIGLLPWRSANAADLAPHTAHYTMKLLSARSGSNIDTASGDIVVRWERDCSGWSMTNRTIFKIGYAGGQSIGFTIDAATWEAASGDDYTFLVRTSYDGKQAERVEGRARIEGAKRFVDFIQPSKKRIDLEPGTIFPMQHTEQVMNAARAGTKFVRATVFDGFTDGGSQFVNAIVGKKQPPPADGLSKFPALRDLAAWTVSLAFFPQGEAAAEPDSEIGMKMMDNGVAAWMDMDFGDFRLRGDLDKLQLHEPAVCR
ncbi:MAG: EipB family protein [Alphaproteobacteria bacterium]